MRRKQPVDRKNPPLCGTCHHPKNFHSDGRSCKALSCECKKYVKAKNGKFGKEKTLVT